MNSIHSLQQNLLLAGIIYGWRLDAVAIGGLLWILAAVLAEVERGLGSVTPRLGRIFV